MIFMTYTMHLSMVFVFVGDMVGVRLDRGSVLSSALALREADISSPLLLKFRICSTNQSEGQLNLSELLSCFV